MLEQKHMSLRQAAMVIGMSVTTIRTHAEQLGIAIHRRPKHITREVEEKIARELRGFTSPRDIASRLGISMVSVYRYSRAHPELMKKRRDESTQIHQATCRSRLTSVINKYPDWNCSAIRRLLSKEYAWLYRHDRDFLWSQLAKLRHMTRMPSERDSIWKERDRLAHHRIVRAAQALRLRPGKPTRLTGGALSRYAGVEKIVAKHLDRLPKTLAILKASGEKPVQFRKRRIAWAIEESIRSGKPVSFGRVTRMAGISTQGGRSLRTYIRRHVARALVGLEP
jgi:transposase